MTDETVTEAAEVPATAPPAPPAPVAAPQVDNSSAMITQHSAFNKLPIMVKQELAGLPVEKQQAFLEEFNRKAKKTAVGYVCWLFSLHYAYLGKWGLLALYLLSLGGFGLWIIVDAFRMPGIIANYNKDVAVEVMGNLKMVTR